MNVSVRLWVIFSTKLNRIKLYYRSAHDLQSILIFRSIQSQMTSRPSDKKIKYKEENMSEEILQLDQ